MRKRICTICKTRTPRNKSSSYCKKCHNIYQKSYYKRNPVSINKSAIKRKQRARVFIQEAKAHKCMDCGIQYPYYVMDFDHKRDKKFDLSRAISKMLSLESIKKEIDKCDIVCANCHRIRTFKRLSEII